jgi:type II secretory pathway component PulF
MMKLTEISTTAAALGNQIGAGIPMDQAIARMALMQPAYADFWLGTMQKIRSGQLLSDSLPEIWPEALVSAIRAGEQSGSIDTVFQRIEATIELQISLRSSVMKLGYPVGMGVAGLGVFLGFMVFVLPMLAKSLGGGSNSAIFQFSAWLSVFVMDNYLWLIIALAGSIFALLAWIKTPEGRNSILVFFINIPVMREALRDMYFGLWAQYMAMMVKSGISTTNSLKLTAPVLPGVLRESIELFERDLSINNKSISESSDISKLRAGDIRKEWWPFYISNAFIVAEQTGEIDKELLRVAPALIKDGEKTLNRVISIANLFALVFSGILIISPLAAYYSEIFTAIRNAGR